MDLHLTVAVEVGVVAETGGRVLVAVTETSTAAAWAAAGSVAVAPQPGLHLLRRSKTKRSSRSWEASEGFWLDARERQHGINEQDGPSGVLQNEKLPGFAQEVLSI
jgi:hypothetical protein